MIGNNLTVDGSLVNENVRCIYFPSNAISHWKNGSSFFCKNVDKPIGIMCTAVNQAQKTNPACSHLCVESKQPNPNS